MKKFIKSIFVLGLFVVGFSVFADTQKTFLEAVSEEKIKIENMFDTAYNVVYQNFQNSVKGFLTSLDYKGLVCLGVIDDSKLLQQMQNDNKNLKIGFLNAYANLYADALDIEQKQRILKDTNVSLFASGANYESEKTRILNSLSQLATGQANLVNSFKSSYQGKTQKFVDDFNDYSEKNKELLITVGNNIKILNEVDQKYKKLNSDLLEYQIQLAGSGAKFFSRLHILKKASLSGLELVFQNNIDKEVRRNRILTNLSNELSQQKNYALGLYEMQFDEKINMLLDKWYDNKELTQISKEVQQFYSKYMPAGKMQCSYFISSSDFLTESAKLVSKITSFNQNFSSQSTGTVNNEQFQDALTKRIPVVIKLQKDITNTFNTAVVEKRKSMLEEYRKQKDVSYQSSVENTVPSIEIEGSFAFTQAFKKGQFNSDIKILQQLLTSLGYYNGIIDGIYSSQTINAVYQYQLAKGLLKGYEKKPSTWGRMGPATRAQLNKDIVK
ncbi:MAG: peptidoglycan-binding domain-containing protein [Candidatus Absconditabacteria bacterium]|nr:peptidoglycan-binding domain-containing protein [Candidatus Absconditabacteria bacterium]